MINHYFGYIIKRMRRILIALLLLSSSLFLSAQEGKTTFDYLLLPASAHTAALGGNHITVIEPDVSIVFNNPALLGYEMHNQLNLSYLSYVADVGMGTMAYARSINRLTTIGIGVQYTNYGKMTETNEQNQVIGDLTANDITGQIFLSREFSDNLRGGITGKFIYSNYAHNTSIGLGVDLGLSYYNPETEFAWSIVGKNIGRQVKAYEEELSGLPWDIQAGVSKKLDNAPLRFSLTAIGLKQWKFDNPNGKEDSFLKTLGKHLVIGLDIVPNDNFWIGAGFNIKRNSDMKIKDGSKFAGLSAGAGLKVRAFSFGVAYGKYFPNANSLLFSISTSFGELGI